MKKNHLIFGAACVSAMSAWTVTGVSLGADQPRPAFETASIKSAAEWSSSETTPAAKTDAAWVGPIATGLGHELLEPGDGVSIALDQSRSIAVIPTRDDALCFTANVHGESKVATCAEGFAENGILVNDLREAGEPQQLFGLVAKDVDALSLTTKRGEVVEVPVVDGVVWWTSSGDDEVASLTTNRAGEVFVDSERFGTAHSTS